MYSLAFSAAYEVLLYFIVYNIHVEPKDHMYKLSAGNFIKWTLYDHAIRSTLATSLIDAEVVHFHDGNNFNQMNKKKGVKIIEKRKLGSN